MCVHTCTQRRGRSRDREIHMGKEIARGQFLMPDSHTWRRQDGVKTLVLRKALGRQPLPRVI